MRNWRSTLIVFVVIVMITAACGGGTSAGGGAPAGAGGSTQSSAQSPTDAPSGGSAQSPAKAPTNQPPAAQPAKAAGGGTKTAIKLSTGDQPGSSLKSDAVDSIKVGLTVDRNKPAIEQLLWTMPPNTPEVYFGYKAKDAEEHTFTQTLSINGSEVNLSDLDKVPVLPPPSPTQRWFVAQGLAVKAGNSFPVGEYKIDVYSNGKLIQSTAWNIKEKKPAASNLNFGLLPIAAATGFLWNSAHTQGPAHIDPSIFTVVDVPDVPIDENFDYYNANELEQAYNDQAEVDQNYEPFPADVQQEIEKQSDQDNTVQCEQAGGTYDPINDLCQVNEDPAQACQNLGGTYQDNNCFFFPSDEVQLSADIQQSIEAQSNQDLTSQCAQQGGTYDASNDVCQNIPDPAKACEDAGGTYANDSCSRGSSDVVPQKAEATPTSEAPTDTSEATPTSEAPTDTSEATPTSEAPAATSASTPPAPVQDPVSTDGSRNVTFQWEAVPDTTGVTYTIEVTDDAGNVVAAPSSIDVISETVTLDGTGCAFNWRVKATQNGLDGPWSDPSPFSVCSQ